MQGSSSRGAPARRSADAALVPEEVVSECLWFQVSSMYSSKHCVGCVITIMACQTIYQAYQGVEVGSADRLQQLNPSAHSAEKVRGLANGPVNDPPSCMHMTA